MRTTPYVDGMPRLDASSAQQPSIAEPLYFQSGAHTLFGWLHWPAGGHCGDVGIVICKPFGYEAVCAHRSVRAFAEACTGVGAATLRFDYAGTGDSTDIDAAADQIELWTSDIVAAVQLLQERTGVRRVCVIGIRLGALLAGLAISRCPAIETVILVAPILNGPRYLKQLRVTRLAATLLPGGSDTTASSPGGLEISGFHLSEAAMASLRGVDLETRGTPAVTRMLVIDGASLPVSRAWTQRLSDQGMRIDYQALPGMVEMVFTAPQFAIVPLAMVDAVRDWLLRTAYPTETWQPTRPLKAPSAAPALRLSDRDHPASLIERPVLFGPGSRVFGIVTEPPPGERRRRTVLLLNAGADVHTGPSGISVALARSWARRGYTVMRMDFAGLGDSESCPGRFDSEVFPSTAVEDMRAAIQYMRGRYDARDVTVAGMCSGAYHALQSAVAALPVDRLLMVNPQNFFWNERMSIHGIQVSELVSRPAGQRRRDGVLSADLWRRLLTGKVDLAYLCALYAKRAAFHVQAALRRLARLAGMRLPNDLGSQLEDIARRGVRMVFVFARGEPGLDLLRLQAGASLRQVGNHCRLHIIEGADHVFSRLGPRRQLVKILSEELYAQTDDGLPRHAAAGQTAFR